MNLAESALRRPVTVMVVVVGILLAAILALLQKVRHFNSGRRRASACRALE